MSNPEKSRKFRINNLDDCMLVTCVDYTEERWCTQIGICMGATMIHAIGDNLVEIDESDTGRLMPGVYTVDMSDLRIFEEEV